MIEVDIRRAGTGCIDNPVAVLSDYLSKGQPLRILLRSSQRSLVKELLEVAEYEVVREEERDEGYVVIEAVKKGSTMD